jgi:hypothetical protein
MSSDSAQQQSLSHQLAADFGSRFASQTQLLSSLNSSLQPLLAAGPSQQGFSGQERAALNTSAINNAGAAARNARQAAGNFAAGQNNSSGLQSGVQKQINASIDSSAANNLATNQNQIVQADYNAGRQNYQEAVAGLNALSGQYNPGQFSGQAQSGINDQFSMDKEINAENNAKQAAIAGGIASLAGDALTFGMGGFGNLDTTGGSTGGEQAGNFFSGGIKALGGG